jgi:hypothetical protein
VSFVFAGVHTSGMGAMRTTMPTATATAGCRRGTGQSNRNNKDRRDYASNTAPRHGTLHHLSALTSASRAPAQTRGPISGIYAI